jgi:hypothetical protein
MIKLYKRISGRVMYWEAWDADDHVVLHRGEIGDTGESCEIPIEPGQTAEQIIQGASQEPLADGYAEIAIEDHTQIIVQFKTQDEWGDNADLEKRHEVDDLLNECLGWTGNGHCDGGDIGSGTINSYSYVVDPHVAKDTIVQALEENHLAEGAVIAIQTEDDYEVLWPEDYNEPFSPIPLSALSDRQGPQMLVPPWVMFQNLKRDSSEWDSGPAAEYMRKWRAWFQSVPAEGRAAYPSIFQEPEGWAGFYESVISDEP